LDLARPKLSSFSRAFEKRADLYHMDAPEKRIQNLLVFHSSGLDCAFPLEAVREIVPMASLSSPPGLPSGLLGFLGLRGTAIPIVRLDRLFGLAEQKPGLHTPMIILRGVLGPIGILADSVRGIVPASSAALLDLPEDGTFQGCGSAVLQLDGGLIHLLSPAALLQASEDRRLSEYSAMSQARLLHLPGNTLGEPT
jgi:purine-binding chemotaxis protein CheW